MKNRNTRFALHFIIPGLALATLVAAPRAHGVLAAGSALDPSSATQADGLLPPEVLEFYRKGEWKNSIADWPEGQMARDPEFTAGTKQNAGRLDLDQNGGIVDKQSGKPPLKIIGFPFPGIDSKDPQAGTKILWNYFYGAYNLGNAHVNVDLTWISRSGLDRKANLDTHFLMYDGQKDKYLPKENSLNLLVQSLASVTSPQDLYGTMALTWRYRESQKRDNVWMYLPALRRVRELSPANRSDGFLGSELTQDDGPFFDGKPEDFAWSLVGETEMYRLADPQSLKGETKVEPLAEGGWRAHYAPGPFVGFEDPAWKGAPWAPLLAVLAKRKTWIIEGVPKDKYYLYGKIELYVDKENFQGAWNRKFSWSGELVGLYTTLGYRFASVTAADGSKESFWGTSVAYNAAINLKKDRATVTGFPLAGRDQAQNLIRVRPDPTLFEYQSLQRRGK